MGGFIALAILAAIMFILVNDTTGGGTYACRHCHQRVWRDSKLPWLRSFCGLTGDTVRLWRVR